MSNQQVTYSYSLKEQIKIETDQAIEVSALIKHLQALEKVAKQSNKTFSALTNTEVISVDLLIEEIEHGSLWEDIVLKLTFKDQQNLDQFLETSRNWIIDNPMTATTIGLGGIVLGGLIALGISRLKKNTPPEGAGIIINNYGTMIHNGAGALNIGEDVFKNALEQTEDKAKLAQNAQKFAQMAKSPTGAAGSITFGNPSAENALEIPANVVSHIPLVNEQEPSEDKETTFENITLQIRSLDRDKYTGWLGYIEGAFTQRLPIEIPLTVDLSILAKQEAVKATVTLVYREKGDKIERKKIILDTLHTK